MNRNVVITGANRGIGLALVNIYLAQQCTVYAVCRQASAALKASGADVIENIDVSDPDAIQRLVKALHDIPIDLLINNAGVWGKQCLGNIDYHEMQRLFAVNALAPIRVTEALWGNMGSGSKVALVTSRMGSIADNSSGQGYDYRMSKAALNMAGKTMAVDLKDNGIAVAILHPGFVQTDMVGGAGDISAEVAAQRLSQRIAELTLQNTGTFWHSNGDELLW